jgi:hypothetical protein
MAVDPPHQDLKTQMRHILFISQQSDHERLSIAEIPLNRTVLKEDQHFTF